MSTYAFVASHHTVDLTTVAALSAGASGIPDVLSSDDARQLGVTGAVVLATCNRLEMYVQLPIAAHLPAIRDMITSSISGRSGLDSALVSGSFDLYEGEDAVRHLLTVASGLESAVVGEREIAGQVRRALASAQEKAQRDERPCPASWFSSSNTPRTRPARSASTPSWARRDAPSSLWPWIWPTR